MTERRRQLLTIDDPLDVDTARPVGAQAPGTAHRDLPELRALYVRLPATEFDDLARAAFEIGAHKRELVGALIRTYVDPHTPAGLAALQELLVADKPNSERGASPDREQAR